MSPMAKTVTLCSFTCLVPLGKYPNQSLPDLPSIVQKISGGDLEWNQPVLSPAQES